MKMYINALYGVYIFHPFYWIVLQPWDATATHKVVKVHWSKQFEHSLYVEKNPQ